MELCICDWEMDEERWILEVNRVAGEEHYISDCTAQGQGVVGKSNGTGGCGLLGPLVVLQANPYILMYWAKGPKHQAPSHKHLQRRDCSKRRRAHEGMCTDPATQRTGL